jgi:hypothetical protein
MKGIEAGMNTEATSNRIPFKVDQCSLPEWMEREFDLSTKQERQAKKRFRFNTLREVARKILVGVPLPAFVIHTQNPRGNHALVSGGDYLGMLRRLFLNEQNQPAGFADEQSFVIHLALIDAKRTRSRQAAIAAVIDEECISKALPSPESPPLSSLLQEQPPADLPPSLMGIWAALRDDVRDFQIAYFELNRTRSELAFQCRAELLTGDRGMGRLLIRPALDSMPEEERRPNIAWLGLERPGALSDLAEAIIEFAKLLSREENRYEQFRAHGRELYGLSRQPEVLPSPGLVKRLASLDSPDVPTIEFLRQGLTETRRFWQECLKPMLLRPTDRLDVVIPLVFLTAGVLGPRANTCSPDPNDQKRTLAIRFWRSLLNSSGTMTAESIGDLVLQTPRTVPPIDDPRHFLERALPRTGDRDPRFEDALLDYLNSPSVLPKQLLPPHPPANYGDSSMWVPLHERTQLKPVHREHLFARKSEGETADTSRRTSSSHDAPPSTPVESFLNKWLLDGKLNQEKSAKTIQEFIEAWRKKYPLAEIARWARAHGIPSLEELGLLSKAPDQDLQLRTLLGWRAMHTWKLLSHLQLDRNRVALSPAFVWQRLLQYLPPNIRDPS